MTRSLLFTAAVVVALAISAGTADAAKCSSDIAPSSFTAFSEDTATIVVLGFTDSNPQTPVELAPMRHDIGPTFSYAFLVFNKGADLLPGQFTTSAILCIRGMKISHHYVQSAAAIGIAGNTEAMSVG